MNKNKKKGYTLVEVLAAFAILSIAILPIISMYPAVFKINTGASAASESARIAFTVIDFIKAKGYYNLIGDGTRGDHPLGAATLLTASVTGITDTPATDDDNTKAFIYDLVWNAAVGGYVTQAEDSIGENDSVAAGPRAFESDFNFGTDDPSGNPFFVVNSKGFDLGNFRIAIVMRRAKVYSKTAFRSPIIINQRVADGTNQNVGESQSMYGFRTEEGRGDDPIDEFIVGKVIIGRGKEIERYRDKSGTKTCVERENLWGSICSYSCRIDSGVYA